MSQKNKAIVEKINAAFAEGNNEGFLEQCLDNVSWNMIGEETRTGVDTIREFLSSMEGSEPPKFTVDKIIAEGDSVACYGDMTMKGEDGIESKYSFCDVYEFSGDKIANLQSFVVKHKSEPESGKKASA